MAKYLVIVESPAKVKTVKKYLGSNYEVAASMGHVRDLPKSQLGIDIEHDFEPKYITIRGKGELLASLRKAAKKAEKVYLATDPDREGEAISWHLSKALNLDESKMQRITFNEITRTAVKASIKQARDIDMNLVDEQQARRCLDRMVGYEISPLLWKKIKRGLSAGRVQSVALRIIGDREEEINAFIPKEYWTLEAELLIPGEKKPLLAKFHGKGNEKISIETKEQLDGILSGLDGVSYQVSEVKKGERAKKAPLPFTTSTLQQEASKALNYSTQKTMRLAQQLYEGVEIKGKGTVALISYLRTDSTRISEEADLAARSFIKEQYGDKYAAVGDTTENKNKKAQDAHEAIRPTDVTNTPVKLKDALPRDLFRLYQLIWKRFVASRMQPAVYETISARISAGEYLFTASSSRVAFDGFMSVYTEADDEKKENNVAVRGLEEGTGLTLEKFVPQQHFTQPPAHYTEASLVKTLEELGIGRPSTYAPTITTIINRRYVAKENKNLYMTELGEVVNNMMKQAFPSIVDVNFTATMESLLDKVGDGTVQWKTVVRNFWPDLYSAVQEAEKELAEVKVEDEVTDVICENCGRNMVVKYGPHGKFLACPGFPECKNTKPYLEKIGVPCPKCGSEVILRKTKKGRKYYGCEKNPECDFMSWQKPSLKKCPSCGGYMVEKGNKLVCADEHCGYVEVLERKD
ncbi:MAG: type I DNA topoisomerase [Fusicatenibacter sp.]|nr:type I DNA topoisomerase [Fusicatenibacter sp.]